MKQEQNDWKVTSDILSCGCRMCTWEYDLWSMVLNRADNERAMLGCEGLGTEYIMA